MQVMIELTVVFKNQSIPNKVLLTGPFEEDGTRHYDAIIEALADLHDQAENELDAPLEDGQCFYRFFRQ